MIRGILKKPFFVSLMEIVFGFLVGVLINLSELKLGRMVYIWDSPLNDVQSSPAALTKI